MKRLWLKIYTLYKTSFWQKQTCFSQLDHNVEVHEVSLYAHNFCMLAHWYGSIVSFLCHLCSKVESLATYFYRLDCPFLLLYWVWEYERIYGNLKLMIGKMEMCMIPWMKILHTRCLIRSFSKDNPLINLIFQYLYGNQWKLTWEIISSTFKF